MGIKWKEDYSAKTQRAFGLVIGLVVGSLFGLVLAKGWPDENWSLDWSAIAAIATFAATWSALHLSQKEGRRRFLLDRSVATIAVGATIATLHKYERGLNSLLSRRGVDKFGKLRESTEVDIHQIDIFERHQSVLIGLKEIVSESQLEKMIVLPEGFSGRVAAVSAEAILLLRHLEHIHPWLSSIPSKGRISDREDVISYWFSLKQLHLEMADLLVIARRFFNAETGKELL